MPVPDIIPSELFTRLNEYRLQKEFWDVLIKVGDRTFHCHRIILASAFQYFRKVFSKKSREKNKKVIELKGINADDFELLLTHVYGGSVSLDENNVYRLLKLAVYSCLQTLEDSCVKYLSENGDKILLSTAFNIFSFASNIQKTILLEKFVGCIAKNFEHVLQSETFLFVRATDLLKVLRHPDLNKNSLVAYNFLEKWVQFQSDEDKKLLPDLLEAINPNESPSKWSVKILTARNDHPCSSSIRSKLLKSAIEQSDGIIIGSKNDGKRITTEEDFFINENIIFSDQDKGTLPFIFYTLEIDDSPGYEYINLHRFENHNKIWPMNVGTYSENDSLTQCYCPGVDGKKLQFCKSIFINKLHYLILMQDSPSCDWYDAQYNLHTDRYYYYRSFICHAFKQTKELPVLNYNSKGRDILNALEITQCGSNIYLYTDYKLMELDCETHEWTELYADGLEKTAYPSLVSYDNNLYLIGGKLSSFNGPMLLSNNSQHKERNGKLFQHYDTRTGKWSQLPTLAYARSKTASYIHEDTLYVSGGEGLAYFKGYLECFDFKAGRWYKSETSMPEPKFNHILRGYDNCLWFFGGQKYKENEIVDDLTWYFYDAKENKWSDIYTIPVHHNKFTVQKILDVVVTI